MALSSPSLDLAEHHSPLSGLFEQPTSPEEWEQYALTEEQIQHFQEHGYITGLKILTEEQCDVLLEELDGITQPDHPRYDCWYTPGPTWGGSEQSLLHALGAWRVGVGFHDLLWSPAFRMAAFQLLGGPFRFYHDQVFAKPPEKGGVVSWHQDYSYWTWTKPQAHLTCWVGLDDATMENGCLCYIPGSHKWPLKPSTGLTGDINAAHAVLSPDEIAAFDTAVPMELTRGYANIHHSMMMHGSYLNQSDRPRRATVVNVFRDGVVSNMDGDKQGDQGLFGWIERGKKCEGHYYPLLFDGTELEAEGEAAGGGWRPAMNEGVQLDMSQFDAWMARM